MPTRNAFYIPRRLAVKRPKQRQNQKRSYYQAFKHYAKNTYNTAKKIDNAIGKVREGYHLGQFLHKGYKMIRRYRRQRQGLPRYHDDL